MTNKSSKDSKRYKTSATLFSITGLLLIIVGIVGGEIAIFLPIGIALIIISTIIWQYSNKLTDNESKDFSKH